jgi:hypothetical protein
VICIRPAAALALALLAGCGTTRNQVVDQGMRQEFTSIAAPLALAKCTAANANSFSSRYSASLAELVRPESYLVAVHRTDWNADAIVVAYAMPALSGSQLLLYTSRELDAVRTADWVARLRRGC